MTMIQFRDFAGMNPRSGLSNMQNTSKMVAERAVNVDLLSGDLRPHRQAKFITGLGGVADPDAAFRIPNASGPGLDHWEVFDQRYTHFLEAPLVNDSFNRWYWTTEGSPPQFNTQARIVNGDPSYRLGVPRPIGTPNVLPPSENEDLLRTRCYVYCFVNQFGEVGPPSPVQCDTGDDIAGWVVSNMDTVVPAPWDTEGAPIDTKRIYRTVTGVAGGSFFFVADVPLAQASYTDNEETDIVAYQEQINTDDFTPPPDDLVGLIAHPNGFLAAYRNNELWLTFPYRPHAWPVEYVLSTESNIMGLGVYGNSIVVTTEAHPYHCTGVHPEAMSFTKYSTTEPNLSRDSVVSAPQGVYYAGFNGLILADNQRFTLVTQDILTYTEWQARYQPTLIRGTRFGFQYIAWTAAATIDEEYQAAGFLFTPDEERAKFSELKLQSLLDPVTPDITQKTVDNTVLGVFQTDKYNGRVVATYNQELFYLFGLDTPPSEFLWKSKEHITARPVNFGVIDIDFTRTEQFFEEIDSIAIEWNKQRIAMAPLDTLGGGYAIGSSDPTHPDDLQALPVNRQPVGGSPLYAIGNSIRLSGDPTVVLQIYADRQLVDERVIDEPGQYRLVSGFKAHRWQFQFVGNCEVKYMDVAETGKELASV